MTAAKSRQATPLKLRKRRVRRKPLTEAQIKAAVRSILEPYMSLHCYYRGYDPAIDREIEKLVGKESAGSGFSFDAALRDIDFYFKSEASASAAAAKIKAAKLRGVRVFLRTFKEVR